MKKIKKHVNGTDKIKDAVEVLNKAEQGKRKQCSAEIEAVLGRYGYTLQIRPASIILQPKGTDGGS